MKTWLEALVDDDSNDENAAGKSSNLCCEEKQNHFGNCRTSAKTLKYLAIRISNRSIKARDCGRKSEFDSALKVSAALVRVRVLYS